MNNNEPNKIVSSLFKQYLELSKVTDADKHDYKAEEILKTKLANITRVRGAIEVMSKNNILKLVKMQSSLRFMAHHSFYIEFARACEDALQLS